MKLCESGRLVAEQIASKTGAWREQIADAVENYRLHKGAFSIAQKYYKMLVKDELKAKEWRENVSLYLDIVDDNFKGHEGDLAKQAEKKAANGNGESPEERVKDNVTKLRGIKPIKDKPASPAADAAKDLSGESGEHPIH